MNTSPDKAAILDRILGMKTLCHEGKKEVIALVEAIIRERLTPPLDPAKTYILVHKLGIESAVVLLPANSKKAYAFNHASLTPHSSNLEWSRKEAEYFVSEGTWLISATFGGEK